MASRHGCISHFKSYYPDLAREKTDADLLRTKTIHEKAPWRDFEPRMRYWRRLILQEINRRGLVA